MKLIVCLVFIVGVCGALYLFFIHIKKINWKALIVTGLFGLALFILFCIAAYESSKIPDTWCTTFRNSTSYPPANLITSTDYFEKGNYDYDTGRCKEAVADYAKSIELNSKYPEVYNNRAYTYMRMGDYKNALTDLNKALEIDPNYINALMNRGDIHNYYFEIDKGKAIADYEKIISIAGAKGTTVCGHLAMAKYSKNVLSFPKVLIETINCNSFSF